MNILQSQHVCNQTWKTEGRGEQFVAKCDYYDLSLFFLFFYSLRDRWVAEPFQNKQTRKHTNNSPPCFTVPCSPYSAGPDAKKTPLGEQLKSNDRELLHDSSTDRLFPIRLDIGLPLTEKSTDSRRPVVEDMEVSFSKCSRLSYCGFQHSEDITCFLCEASLQLQGAQHLSSAAACVGVSFWKTHTHTTHTAFCSFIIIRAIYAKTPRNKHVKRSSHSRG